MTLEEAIKILHPDTTRAALWEIEYFAGFNGQEARIKACEAACIVACEAMQREIDHAACEINGYIETCETCGFCIQPANEPLALDELRGMDGEPIKPAFLIDQYDGEYNDFGHCSECGALNLDDGNTNYCCGCGAHFTTK